MFPGAAPFGFYNAPVSKALIVLTGAASALNLVLLPALRIRHNAELFDHFRSSAYSNIFLGVSRTLYYSNLKNLFFGSLLLYSFRIFEHRYGSKKYANYLLGCTVIGAGLQYAALWILLSLDSVDELPTGPFRTIFSLFVLFYLSVPSVGSSNFLGLIPVTRKVFTYFIGLQMLLASRGSLLSGISGLVAGVFYHLNICYVQHWLRLPNSVSDFSARVFGAFFQSSAPANEGRIEGATLEIQRQLRMDELDQQLWRLQEANLTRRPVDNRNARRAGQGFPDVLIGNPNDAAPGADEIVQQPTVEVSEEQVQRLIEMGFTRQAVLQALTASNNDMAVAMNILLAE